MVKMIFRRIILGMLSLILVSGIVFGSIEALPGDSCTAYLGRLAQGTRLDNCREDFGLNRPAMTRYVEWASKAMQGDFGQSLKRKKPVSDIILPRLRNTILLGVSAALIGVPLAIFLGIISGLWRDRRPDLWISTGAIFAMTVPRYTSLQLLAQGRLV